MSNPAFLLKLEWLKYQKNRSMLVFILASLALYPIAFLLMYSFTTNIIPDDFPFRVFDYPNLWALTGYVANWITYFLVVITGIYIVTMEYTHKTLRQNVITGLRRGEFFLSKLLFLVILSTALTIWYFLTTALFGLYAGSGFSFDFPSDLRFILSHALMVFGYGILGMIFGLLFRSLGLSFILFFLYASFLEPIISRLLHRYVFGGDTHLFYPANAFKDLLPFPFYSDLTGLMPPDQQMKMALTSNEAIISCLIYLVIFLVFLNWRFKKSDL